jgi:hypothetical protein
MGAPTFISARRVALAVLGFLAIAGLMLLTPTGANAQINPVNLVCGILQSLGNLFGGFLSGILGFLLQLFGCAPASP